MTLTRGLYYIYFGTSHVYRHPIEDLSLRQKRIFVLPNDVSSISPWNIEPTGDGRYLLKALGAPVAEDEGLLWAFLLDEKKDYEWVITLQSDDSFTIDKPSGEVGWIKTDDESSFGSQIAVKEFASDDLSNRLFRIVPVDD